MTHQPPTASVPSIPLGASRAGIWSPAGAVLLTAIVLGTAMAGAFAIATGYREWWHTLDAAAAESWPRPDSPATLMSLQIASQLFELALIAWLVGRWHTDRAAALNLVPVRLSAGEWIGAAVLLFAVKALATIAAQAFGPSDPRSELGPIVALVRSQHVWLVFLAAVVLAALTEELIFRGVLSRTLEATRLGFWGGAAVASAAFAALHMQYGPGGQLVIFAVGMTLAWIRARWQSLWPAIVCHAANNAVALLAILAIT